LPSDLTVRGDLTVYGDLTVGTVGAEPALVLPVTDNSQEFCVDLQPSEQVNETQSPVDCKSLSGVDITSIAFVAQRRERRNRDSGIELTVEPFQGSKIVTDAKEAKTLYLALPFRVQPLTHLLFSSSRDGRSLQKMHELIDGIGITVVLVQCGEFRFGGFAASKWNCDGVPFGDPSGSFLFSLSQDAMISYQNHNDEPCVLCATNDTLTFGRYDLALSGDFDRCSSELENNYGVGWARGSTEAQTFLAGQANFRADHVEVWGFFTIESE
jgi:hypothetical protein